jgi:hypothetical protein
MPKDIPHKSIGRRSRCSFCGGSFGIVRFRFERLEFCGKRCLNRYLAKRTEQPTSLQEWIEETRKKRSR